MRKLYVAMVGLPARGKSTLARRLRQGLREEGIERVFVLDTFTAIGKTHNRTDGLHLEDEGLVAWRDAIVENAKNAAGT